MTARVANTRERIVLGVKVDQTAAGTSGRLKGRFQTVRMAGNRKTLLLEKIADSIVGSVLLIREFRIGPDLCEHRFSP